jgi:serine/threonine-protein kinase
VIDMVRLRCAACGHGVVGGDGATHVNDCPICGGTLLADGATVAERAAEPPTVTHVGASSEVAPETVSPALPAIQGYEVISEIGRGGMGIVYRARQATPRRTVAIKMLLGGEVAGTDRQARFRAEIAAAARLQHPNIVAVHEVGEHGGRPYFAMEFIEGGTLGDRLRGGPLPPVEAAELIATLAAAVQHAHERGVVHRDLKPANILMSEVGLAKIADFGLAKHLEAIATFVDGPKTQAGAVLGTPGYMAPEQASGRVDEVGPRTDVYALGAILYECLTGQAPFRAATMYETLVQVARSEPAPPRRLAPGVPRDLEVICLKCLRKAPGDRYATAGELAADLRRFLAGRPIAARPPSAAARIRHWLRRRRELVYLAGGIAIAAGLSVAALVLWPASRATSPSTESNAAELPLDLRLVPGDAWGFVTIRSADLWAMPEPHDLVRELGEKSEPQLTLNDIGITLQRGIGVHPRDIERVTFVFRPEGNSAAFAFAVLAMTGDYTPDRLRDSLVAAGELFPEPVAGKTMYATARPNADAVLAYSDRVVQIGRADVLRGLAATTPPEAPAGPLAAALRRAAEPHAIALGLRPGADFLVDLFLSLKLGPAEDAVGRATVVSLVGDVRPAGDAKEVGLEAWLEYASEEQAFAAAAGTPRVIRALIDAVEARAGRDIAPGLIDELMRPARAANWELQGNTLHARATIRYSSSDVHSKIRLARHRAQIRRNMDRVAEAMKAYHAANGRFPPATVTDADGKPLYSWRVLLLPYLNQQDLYRRFHLNRAWDHPSNATLLRRIPKEYAMPGDAKDTVSTPIQVLVGPGGLFDNAEGRQLSQITDGAANTFLLIESGDIVPWSKPADVVFDPRKYVPHRGLFPGAFHATTADFVTHSFADTIPERVFLAHFTRAGGETIPKFSR